MMHNPQFGGVDVYRFDGTNHEDIVKALGLEVGDAVAVFPDRPSILIKDFDRVKVTLRNLDTGVTESVSWVDD